MVNPMQRARSLANRLALAVRLLRTKHGRERLVLGVAARAPRALHRLARSYRRHAIRRTRIIAVVGSFGKTTATRAIFAALGNLHPRFIGWNCGTALPAALLRIRPGSRYGVIETAITGRDQMQGHAELVRPDLTVVTAIGSEHHNSLGTLETTRSEKARMVEALPASGTAVLNAEDPNVLWMQTRTKASVITYGTGASATVRATEIDASRMDGVRFRLHIGTETRAVRTRLIGAQMVYPVLAACAVAVTEGLDMDRVLRNLQHLEPTPNRLQPLPHSSGAWILLDAYKAAEETIETALDVLEALSAERRIVVIGDVEEPRGSQGPLYRALGLRISEVADRVVFVGGKTNFNRLKVGTAAGGLPRERLWNVRGNPLEAARLLEEELRPGDVVLIKGRCTQHLARIAHSLSGREVGCLIRTCPHRYDCLSCPQLRRGI